MAYRPHSRPPCFLFPILSRESSPDKRAKEVRAAGPDLLVCIYLWGTCQMLSAYSATARSAAKMPLRAILRRLMRFHCSTSV